MCLFLLRVPVAVTAGFDEPVFALIAGIVWDSGDNYELSKSLELWG